MIDPIEALELAPVGLVAAGPPEDVADVDDERQTVGVEIALDEPLRG